jgi:glycosyltransferase involved in cell wall biosynthesis
VVVIPPGSDGVAVVRRGSRATRRLRVLCVANWSPSKGIATLVAAAARVPEVHLDLVGDPGTGAYRAAVLERIRSRALRGRVTVHGALGEHELAVRYSSADIFALPTQREGYGTVFAEALAHGLPVVAADIAAVREVVGDAGIFVPPRRVRPLARALRLMTDDWLRSRLARAGRARARALPRWAVSARAFVALVRSEMRNAVARS